MKFPSTNHNYATDTAGAVFELVSEEQFEPAQLKVDRAVAQIVRLHVAEHKRSNAVVIGSLSGKTAFQLSSICDQVGVRGLSLSFELFLETLFLLSVNFTNVNTKFRLSAKANPKFYTRVRK